MLISSRMLKAIGKVSLLLHEVVPNQLLILWDVRLSYSQYHGRLESGLSSIK